MKYLIIFLASCFIAACATEKEGSEPGAKPKIEEGQDSDTPSPDGQGKRPGHTPIPKKRICSGLIPENCNLFGMVDGDIMAAKIGLEATVVAGGYQTSLEKMAALRSAQAILWIQKNRPSSKIVFSTENEILYLDFIKTIRWPQR